MKTAVITGASSGIGRDIARQLSAQGWRVVLAARRQERLEQLAKELPGPSEIYCADLSKPEQCRALYEQVSGEDVELLVNAAGFGVYGLFAETELERELMLIDVDIRAVHILTKLFVRDFVQKNRGCILNVASSAGFMAGPRLASYYAAKSYVVRLSEALAEELRDSGSAVTVSCLCPGPVATEFNQVAGVHASMRELSSEEVAALAIKETMKGKLLIVPGLSIKMSLLAGRLLPDSILTRINHRIQKRKQR